MKKMLFLLPLLAVSLIGCGNNNSGGSSGSNVPVMEKHEVTLNMTNYLTYFDVSYTSSYNQNTYDFKGCLSYAFYEDAVVTFLYYTDTSQQTSKTEEVKLNAGGNGHFVGGGKYLGSVNAIRGKVIYWM